MRIIPEVEADLRRTIRDARAKDPLITSGRIKELLQKKYGRGFSYQYIARLVEKVAREALIEVDRAQIEKRISATRENYRLIRDRLSKIVYWQPDSESPGERKPSNKDVIEAAKNIMMMDLALLSAEMTAGIYKKPIAEIAKTFHYEPLPGEIRTVIISSWARGGLLPKSVIEQMAPTLPGNREV
jgi:hypothetical protein